MDGHALESLLELMRVNIVFCSPETFFSNNIIILLLLPYRALFSAAPPSSSER